MQLVEKFHQMESEHKLFEIGREIDLPIWDIIRYNVFRNLNYPEKDRIKLDISQKKKMLDFFILIKEIIKYLVKFPFKKAEIIIFTSSRYINQDFIFYDKSATPIINNLNKNYLVIESLLGKKTAYNSFYDMTNVIRRCYYSRIIDKSYYKKIETVLSSTFGLSPISYNEFNGLIKTFKVQYLLYSLLLKLKKPDCLIICTGNPKATIKVCKKYRIKTYLVQHASIELDEIDYSYPSNITEKDFILFSDYLLTFGSYWCKNINAPARKIIPIGNNYFAAIPKDDSDRSILFISTIVHGLELSKLALDASKEWPAFKIIYKLHPNEYQYKNEYLSLFKDCKNIQLISNEIETNILIAKSQLVVLIVSAVLYEALQQGKKVAIYKRVNYERQLLMNLKTNLYFFDNLHELTEILMKDIFVKPCTFFEPSNDKLICKIFNDNCYNNYRISIN